MQKKSSMAKLVILITGGSGFIGRNLLEKLPKNYHLLAPSHQELNLLDTSKVEKYFNERRIDVVVHCSNIGGTRNAIHLSNIATTNLRVFFNIVRCKERFKKIIFLGSGAEYDKSKPLKKVREDDFGKRIPIDEYGFYKYTCSKIIENSENIINLRLFGVYGKYEDYNLRFISEAICRNILSLPIMINQNVFFDYLYINDLVKIIDFFIRKKTTKKFFNVGTGKRIDLLAIAKNINEIAEKKSKIIVKRKGLQNEYTCDNTLLKKELQNFVFTDFKASLYELYTYYKSIGASLRIVV